MSSIRSIATKAGVSIATVSRVLNNHPQVSPAVRKRVLIASNKSGYVPTVGKKSTSNIALLFTSDSSVGSPFDSAILHGMSRGMEKFGYDLMILSAMRSRNAGESMSQMLIRKGVCGAVVRTTLATRSVVMELADEKFPFVIVADRFEDERINYVFSDSIAASREAVEHLIGLGHTRIAVALNIIDDSDHADRLLGYRQALGGANIEYDEKNVFRVAANRDGGVQLLRRMMTRVHKPTALFLADPMTVVGLLNEARRMGIDVPGDLSVVGFDDADLRFMVTPQITAVCQDAVGLGRAAITALHQTIENTTSSKASPVASPSSALISTAVVRKAMPTWLEIHDSTSALKSALKSVVKKTSRRVSASKS